MSANAASTVAQSLAEAARNAGVAQQVLRLLSADQGAMDTGTTWDDDEKGLDASDPTGGRTADSPWFSEARAFKARLRSGSSSPRSAQR